MKTKVLKKTFVTLMAVAMLLSALPFSTYALTAVGGVQTKIDEIAKNYPTGSYFSANGKACGHSQSSTCSNCKLSSVSSAAASVAGDANTCVAFAKYVFWYIFGTSFKKSTSQTVNLNSINSVAKVGDYIEFYNSSGNNTHDAIYLSGGSNGFYAYTSNYTCANDVKYNRYYTSSDYSNYTFKVYHASNYDAVNNTHTHSYERGYEADHPHRVYMKCSCGDYYYTGETTKTDICELCYPLKVVATDETKLTGFVWNNFENVKSYDLRIYKKSNNENILTTFGITKNEYSYNLPAGIYRAELCAGYPNGSIDWFPTVDFTVNSSPLDFQPTDTVFCGDKIYALFENAVSYDYAKLASEKMGGHLASIHSEEEQEVIEKLILNKNTCFWLGGTDSETEGFWKWEDGTDWDYENWAQGEPNNDATYYGNENYLEIRSNVGLWNDAPHRYNFNYGFIAEFFIDEIAASQSTSKTREEYDSNLKYYIPKSKYILFNKAVPWEVAEAYCESLGGHLATITSSDEDAIVSSIVENGTYLIGATDKYNEGAWQWVNGEEFAYTNWKNEEPNDYSQGEDYASIATNGWNDRPNIESVGFVCEIDIENTYPEKPQIEVEVVGNEIYALWNKCDKADIYNAYLTYYITEDVLINNGIDPESFYASAVWEVEDQELNVGAFIDNYAYTCFVAQRNVTYRVKVEAINSISETKTVAYSEPIIIEPTVITKTLSSIAVNSLPIKTSYEIGEELDTAGLTLKLTYSDNSTEIVSSGFTISGFNSATAGATTVTVSYGEKATTFTVFVNQVTLNEPHIIVESKKALTGKEFALSVDLSKNSGLAYLKLALDYDSSAFELISATNAGLLGGTYTTSKTTDVKPYIIQWMGADNSTGDGNLLTLTFKAKDDATVGDYTIGLSVVEAYNEDYDEVAIAVQNGNIKVQNVLIGDFNGDGKINGKDGILCSQALAGWDVEYYELAADVNGDGKFNGKDGILLSQYLAGWDVVLG